MKEAIEKKFHINYGKLVPAHPHFCLGATNEPNQKFEISYTANGYIDIIRPKVIKNGDIYGEKIQAFITPYTIEIDTLEDLEYARWKINHLML
jgi:CMP-N-acetylneuraminic acid synthetase